MRNAPTGLHATFDQGCAHHLAGHLDAAIVCYRQSLDLQPDFAAAYANLGNALQAKGQVDAAIACLGAAVTLRPDFVEAHFNQGNALLAAGRLDEAIDRYRHAIALRPSFVEAHVNLGIALHHQRRFDDAIAALSTAVSLDPGSAQALDGLGNALSAKGLLAEAAACHHAAIARAPDFAEAHANLGNVLHASGFHDLAAACHRIFLSLRPHDPGGHTNLGNALLEIGHGGEAIACHRDAVMLAPDSAAAHANLGTALQQGGFIDEAVEAFTAALRHAPRQGDIHRMLANTGRITPDSPQARAMAALLQDVTLPDSDRLELHFALGAIHGDVGDAHRALDHLLAGNRLKRARTPYDEVSALATMERIAEVFAPAFLASRQGVGAPSDAPVFVVGMPRSGTTLVEQILGSHPDCVGAGELPDLPRLLDGVAFPDGMTTLSDEALRRLGQRYVDRLRARAPNAARVVDKLPDNFRRVGLIHLILPGAKIIHVRRDPLDTCLSCFSKLFSGDIPYSYDLAELGRYFRAYERLMDHWRGLLPPGVMLEIRYEDLIADPREHIRGMLDHCALPWDDRCLEFHKTPRSVATASNAQIRRPLYRSSIGRWHALGARAKPLVDALAGSL